MWTESVRSFFPAESEKYMKSVIVIIGYNRPKPLRRCFDYVSRAVYPAEDQVDLYISLDHSDKEEEICRMTESFSWPYGEKKVITHPERLGLRKHVISCGNLIGEHDFLVMLEDDIVVSDSFYLYTRTAVKKYEPYSEICGISLYRPYVYQQVGRPFEPLYNGSDTYLMQVAQSWGQVWTKRMWHEFHDWYLTHQTFEQPLRMADYSYSWDQRSWLRYYMGFAAEQNKYLVYPYHPFSTNMEDAGENRKITDTDYQVTIVNGQSEFRMYDPGNCVRYDAFYERSEDPYFCFRFNGEPVLMDLNATRTRFGNSNYLVSTKQYDYHVIKTYGMQMRPQEVNLIEDIPGQEIYLYDLQHQEKNTYHSNKENIIRYDVRAVSWARLSYLGLRKMVRETGNKIRKKMKKKR